MCEQPAREPADRELRDRARIRRWRDRASARDRRPRLSGVERRPGRGVGAHSARRRARHASGTPSRSSPRSGRSSYPAGSRTATTSAAARSPGSRPRCARWPSSRRTGARCSGSATASRSSARRGFCPALSAPTSPFLRLRGRRGAGRAQRHPSLARCGVGRRLVIPVKHGEGCLFAPADAPRRARARGPDRPPLRRRARTRTVRRRTWPESATAPGTSWGSCPTPSTRSIRCSAQATAR